MYKGGDLPGRCVRCGEALEWVQSGLYWDRDAGVAVVGVPGVVCMNPNCRYGRPAIGAIATIAKRVATAKARLEGEEKAGERGERPPGWRPVDTWVLVFPGAPPAVWRGTGTIWDTKQDG